MAVQQIITVVVPSPSRETKAANTAVPTKTFNGSPLHQETTLSTIGSNIPAVSITPKYRMAKVIMAKVLATSLIPVMAYSKVSQPYPARSPNTIGIRISDVKGLSFFAIISPMKTTIMAKPRSAKYILFPLSPLPAFPFSGRTYF